MTKIVLQDTNSGHNLQTINDNFRKIEDEFNKKVLYRNNPSGEPNEIENDLDMNGNRIYNLPKPVEGHEPLRFVDIGLIPGDLQEYAEESKEWAEKSQDAYEHTLAALAEGSVYIGDYGPGLVIEEYTNFFGRDGIWWRPSPDLELPYTTTGVWEDESNLFKELGSRFTVDTVTNLQLLQPKSEDSIFLVEEGREGLFIFKDDNMSSFITEDPNMLFYVPPSTDTTGASGAWVRKTGAVQSDQFVSMAPENSVILNTTLNRVYIYIDGVWEPVDAYLEDLLDMHIQTRSAHGLRDSNVAIGRNSMATGTAALAIGNDVEATNSYLFGRELFSNSAFSTVLGRGGSVESSDGTHRSNLLISRNSESVLDDCQHVSAIISGGTLTECGNSFIVSTSTNMDPNDYSQYANHSIAIGSSACVRGSSGSPITGGVAIGTGAQVSHDRGVAIGSNTQVSHDNSVAIGRNAQTTADNQIVLGASNTSVVVPGSFSVTGTKNFKIPHPHPSKKDTHQLYHGSYEGPVPGGTVYRYSVTTVNGEGTIGLPDYFEYLNKDAQVWCSPKKHFGIAYGEITSNTLHVTSNQDGEYEVLILGTRKDDGVQNWAGAEVLNDNS